MTYSMEADIGLIGVGVMGSALARNIANHGFHICIFNRTPEPTEEFLKKYGNTYLHGEKNIKNCIQRLKKPRKIIIMVKAGPPVDDVLEELLKFLQKGDMVIDGGNSYFHDTEHRQKKLKKKGIFLIGCGISGGEEGALLGPSLMPGGDKKAYKSVEKILKAIAAKDFQGKPCVTFIGEGASGHYVKMVHNGIEYGLMQILAESYDLLRKLYKISAPKIGEIFANYHHGRMKSYLLEIATEVLKKKDDFQKGYLINSIADRAGEKGTGKWSVQEGFELGVPIPTIAEAVFMRMISAKKERAEWGKTFKESKEAKTLPPLSQFISLLEKSMLASWHLTFLQGFRLLESASKKYDWNINLNEVSRIWQGGCIIRAELLKTIHLQSEMQKILQNSVKDLRTLSALAIHSGIPIPGLLSALEYFETMRSEKLPANFIQGLRDYFGAHTYERVDRKGTFHTIWKKL